MLWKRNFRKPSASRSCFLLILKIPRSILPCRKLNNFNLCSVDVCSRSQTPVRSHFHRAQSHPHPLLQHSCGWLHGEAISPTTRALVNSGHWDQSQPSVLQPVSRQATTKFLSHWEVCNNLTGLKWKNIQGSFEAFESDPLSVDLYGEKTTQTWSQSLYFYTVLA